MNKLFKKIISHKTDFKPTDCIIYLFFSIIFVLFLKNKFNDLENGVIIGISIFCAFLVTLLNRTYKNKKIGYK